MKKKAKLITAHRLPDGGFESTQIVEVQPGRPTTTRPNSSPPVCRLRHPHPPQSAAEVVDRDGLARRESARSRSTAIRWRIRRWMSGQ